jgi:hypothetical protein
MLNEGTPNPSDMITNIVPLKRVVEDGILSLTRADEGLVKILVGVNDERKLKQLVEAVGQSTSRF